MNTQDKILAIGSEFTDQETGEKNVPIYTKDPSTGLMKTKLITIGTDQGIADKNKNLENDIAMATQDIQKNGNTPEAIDYYKTEFQKQYGEIGLSKFNETIG